MDRASIYREMATRWLAVAQRVENPALKKCYTERALRYRMMVTKRQRKDPESNSVPIPLRH